MLRRSSIIICVILLPLIVVNARPADLEQIAKDFEPHDADLDLNTAEQFYRPLGFRGYSGINYRRPYIGGFRGYGYVPTLGGVNPINNFGYGYYPVYG